MKQSRKLRLASPIPSFQRSTDNLLQYLRKGGDLTPAEVTLLWAYAYRLTSLLNQTEGQLTETVSRKHGQTSRQ